MVAHFKNLQLSANELAFVSEQIAAELRANGKGDLYEEDLQRLEEAVSAVKTHLANLALEEGLCGG